MLASDQGGIFRQGNQEGLPLSRNLNDGEEWAVNKHHPLKPCQDWKDLAQGGAPMFVLHMFILASVLKHAETTRAGGAPAIRAVGAAGSSPVGEI